MHTVKVGYTMSVFSVAPLSFTSILVGLDYFDIGRLLSRHRCIFKI